MKVTGHLTVTQLVEIRQVIKEQHSDITCKVCHHFMHFAQTCKNTETCSSQCYAACHLLIFELTNMTPRSNINYPTESATARALLIQGCVLISGRMQDVHILRMFLSNQIHCSIAFNQRSVF